MTENRGEGRVSNDKEVTNSARTGIGEKESEFERLKFDRNQK
jgi:hypothetical protein